MTWFLLGGEVTQIWLCELWLLILVGNGISLVRRGCIMSEQNIVSGKKILLVDDDQGARESIKLLLRIDRHVVTEAQNGREALTFLAEAPFELVIVDYFMPEMPGNELAAQIKRCAPTLPILMVTAYFEKLVDKDNSVDGIIAKPFAVDELRQAIAKLFS